MSHRSPMHPDFIGPLSPEQSRAIELADRIISEIIAEERFQGLSRAWFKRLTKVNSK